MANETCHLVLAECIEAARDMDAKAMASHSGFRGDRHCGTVLHRTCNPI